MKNTVLLMILVMLISCEHIFDTHPYDINFGGEIGINAKQMELIENRFADKDTLHVAFISDTHLWYTELKAEIASMNSREDIDFVIHCGDITDVGMSREFELYRDIISDLRYPYVTLIGNHDFLGTGDEAYKVMFGPMDFSFIASRVKFVCVNTNATEYEDMTVVPDFGFMKLESTSDSSMFDRTVVVMHAPPYSSQFNNGLCETFRQYLDLFPGLMCCVAGHMHEADVDDIYGDGLLFYIVDNAKNRNYRIMTITPDGYETEQVYY